MKHHLPALQAGSQIDLITESQAIHITAINDTATLKETLDIANESGFSRLPVFHERMYNLIGVLNTFDLINQPPDEEAPMTDLVRPAYYVPPNKKIDDLLRELQQRGLHMAIVVDEHGGCTVPH